MTQVASVDYANKRIHLHLDTVTAGFDCIAAYFEINALILANANGEQNHPHMISAEGNIPKGGGAFTPRYALIESGWRFVPYAGVAHTLGLQTEPVSKDGLSGRDVFDRSTLNVIVEIDELYEKVEIRTVNTGSGLSAAQDAKLTQIDTRSSELWQRLGLDPNAPVTTHEDGSITVGNITITASTTGTTPNRQTVQARQ